VVLITLSYLSLSWLVGHFGLGRTFWAWSDSRAFSLWKRFFRRFAFPGRTKGPVLSPVRNDLRNKGLRVFAFAYTQKRFYNFILYYYYYYCFIFDIFTPISTPSPLLARPPPMTQEAVHRVEDGPLPTGVSGRGGAVGLGSSEVSCTFTGGNWSLALFLFVLPLFPFLSFHLSHSFPPLLPLPHTLETPKQPTTNNPNQQP